MGDRLKSAYGEFCSRHNEAVQLYKDLVKSDVSFQAFVKVCPSLMRAYCSCQEGRSTCMLAENISPLSSCHWSKCHLNVLHKEANANERVLSRVHTKANNRLKFAYFHLQSLGGASIWPV